MMYGITSLQMVTFAAELRFRDSQQPRHRI